MIWIISDIHGCYHTLVALVDKVKFADANAKFVFVGDYVDRGLLNKECIDFVIKMQHEGASCLRGNHDDVIDWILNGQSYSDMREHVAGQPDPEKVVHWWLWNGFAPTLESYGVQSHHRPKGPYSEAPDGFLVQADFQEKVPQEHKDFFNNLPLYWENDTHFCCHAWMRPDEELPRDMKFMRSDRAEETLWSRFDRHPVAKTFIPVTTKWDRIGVFGHTPVTQYGAVTPIKYDKIRLIDTGVFLDNYMCAYCCEQDDWLLQSTDSRDIG